MLCRIKNSEGTKIDTVGWIKKKKIKEEKDQCHEIRNWSGLMIIVLFMYPIIMFGSLKTQC